MQGGGGQTRRTVCISTNASQPTMIPTAAALDKLTVTTWTRVRVWCMRQAEFRLAEAEKRVLG